MSDSDDPRPSTTPANPRSLGQLGGIAFLATAAIGRLPTAMIQLGILLFVTGAGAGLAVAGLSVAALGVGTAIGAPLIGRLVDRFGALRVLIGATCVQLLAMAGLLVIDLDRHALLLGLAALLGAANPQVAAAARGRWSRLAREDLAAAAGGRLVGRAMGYESAVDEVSFVLGPAIGAGLIGGLGAHTGLILVAVCTLVGQGAFAVFLATEHASAQPAESARGSLPWLRTIPAMIAGIAVGTSFGGTQTALTAHFEALGQAGVTGAVYAVLGVGSATSSIVTGRLSDRIRTGVRVVVGGLLVIAGALIGMYAAALGPGGLPLVLVGVLLTGLGVGPILVTGFTWMERIAPSGSLTTAMTLMATAIVIGVSLGASLGASIITPELNGAMLLVAGAGLVATLDGLAALVRRQP